MARAIEAFETTLTTPNARFDKFLKGDAKALTAQETRGLALFIDKGCAGCHNGVNLGGRAYAPFGVAQTPAEEIGPAADKGRSVVTKSSGDDFVFRIAPLRNVALRAPYFHSGQVWALDDAVRLMAKDQLGEELSDSDTADIVAFLSTLTGDQPRIEYPILPPRGKDTPRPQL